MNDLDRPVWASLTTFHASMAEGDELARRFLRDVNLFASARDDGGDGQTALAALVYPGERVYVMQVPAIPALPGLRTARVGVCVQMVAVRQRSAERSDEVKVLTDADGPEMLALAALTEPGPFLARTHQMGRFLGIRRAGRLVAMAGERLRFPGYTEVSGVCTHPNFRGQGFARQLSAAVTSNIQQRGDRAFLHAWTTNTPAISIYQALGFEVRAIVNLTVFERELDRRA
jgi:predicted GNAT family acetyltransferase